MQEVVEAGSQGAAQTIMDCAHPPAAPQARQISWAILSGGQPKGVGRPSQIAMHSSKLQKRLAFPPQPPQLLAVQAPLTNAYTWMTASQFPASNGSAQAGAGVHPASLGPVGFKLQRGSRTDLRALGRAHLDGERVILTLASGGFLDISADSMHRHLLDGQDPVSLPSEIVRMGDGLAFYGHGGPVLYSQGVWRAVPETVAPPRDLMGVGRNENQERVWGALVSIPLDDKTNVIVAKAGPRRYYNGHMHGLKDTFVTGQWNGTNFHVMSQEDLALEPDDTFATLNLVRAGTTSTDGTSTRAGWSTLPCVFETARNGDKGHPRALRGRDQGRAAAARQGSPSLKRPLRKNYGPGAGRSSQPSRTATQSEVGPR
jgi:hypothetical protein